MKKLVTLILTLTCILPSCGSTVTDEDIAANLEGYETMFDEVSDGISTEPEYIPTSLTGVEGIISPEYTINDNKYYFITKRRDKYGINGVEMITYVDLETGDSHIICPDPLCEHEEDGKCKYTEFQEIYFADEPGVFYSIRMNSFTPPICRIDLNHDTVTTLYEASTFATSIIGMDNGKLYFCEMETATEDRQTTRRYHLYVLDTSDDVVEDLGYMPDQFVNELGIFYFVHKGELYYGNRNGKLMKTDTAFANQTEICTLGDSDLHYWFYDTKTDELYFNLCNQSENTGAVYVYKDGVTEKVTLPHENIYTFTLTNSKIYYSIYDPIYYGVSAAPGHPNVYDYTGGNIYVTDRNNPMVAELVYDCGGEYLICSSITNYVILNDYLYFQEYEVIHEVDDDGMEYTYFSSSHNVNRIRVNLTTGDMTRIQFE